MPEESFEFVTLDAADQLVEKQSRKVTVVRQPIGSGSALDLVSLPGGICQIGSRGAANPEETPQHLVSLAPFQISRGLITQDQWLSVMGKLPPVRFRDPTLPVENIKWIEAMDFCRRLSRSTGKTYSLPTEAQWEYACRGGTTTAFHTGNMITTDYANYCGEHAYRSGPHGQYRHVTTPMGTFLPNPFGIFDMHGNLWEFCADTWHPDFTAAPFNGQSWETGGERDYRVARGGSWHEPPENCRSSTRLRQSETERDDFFGFRIVR